MLIFLPRPLVVDVQIRAVEIERTNRAFEAFVEIPLFILGR